MGRAYQNRKVSMAKTSDMKAKVYSKYGREIYMSAKSGGLDPAGNLTLRGLIEKAKKDQVPSHVIDKAIDKAKGGGGEDFYPAVYEGYGPGNCMVMVECLTDNPNRTFGDVRECFTKTGGKIGAQGTVAHMFDHDAIFVFAGEEDSTLEALMEADIDVTDVEEADGKVTVFTPNTEYFKAKTALEEAFNGIDFEVDEIQYIAQNTAPITDEDAIAMYEKFEMMLNNLDDVQTIFHNVEF